MYPEEELIRLIKLRDRDAFNHLFEKYAGAMHGLIGQILPGNEYTNELLEESFSLIFQNIDSYDPAKLRLFTWMMQIARQTAIRKLRAVNSRIYTDPSQLLKENAGLAKLVKQLTEEQQELIRLSYFRGYSDEDVARELNMPAEAVRTKIKIALAQLNSLL